MGEAGKTSSANKQNDELSLKDLILQIQSWWIYLLSKWWIVILTGLIAAGLGFVYALVKTPQYVGELTFVVEDSKQSNPLGAYAGLASQFGIDLGGAGGSSVFSGDNIMEFLKSRLLMEKALLSGCVNLEGKKISLAEYYIGFNKMRKGGEEKNVLTDLSFPLHPDRSAFSLQQDSVLNIIQSKIIKDNLKIEKVDKNLSFIMVSCTSSDERFSKLFTEKLVEEAIRFYIEIKTMRNQVNIDRLQAQADSLKTLLNQKTYSAATTQDLNVNPAKQIAGVGLELALRDKFVLQTMYGEVVKNLELSKIAMSQETPMIQIVDAPILPLKVKQLGKLKAIIIGAFIGGVLATVLVLFRRILREIMG